MVRPDKRDLSKIYSNKASQVITNRSNVRNMNSKVIHLIQKQHKRTGNY